MDIQPYLNFDGRCEEAIAFYCQALGAEVVMLAHFADAPGDTGDGCTGNAPPPADKVMHACLRVGKAQILASDCFSAGNPEFKGISLSLSADDDAAATRLFDALADGGTVQQPLVATFFASSFGVVTDRFGVSWMIVVAIPVPG
jgi:PhnB protein